MAQALPRLGILVVATGLALGVAVGWGQFVDASRPDGAAMPLAEDVESAPPSDLRARIEGAVDFDRLNPAEYLNQADEPPDASAPQIGDAAELETDANGFPTYPLPDGNPPPLGPGVFQAGGFRTPLPRSPVWNPAGPKRVGIQIGHWFTGQLPPELQRLSAGTSAGGWSEWEANLLIGQQVVQMLQDAGVEADLLPATIPIRYRAHAFVAIHADGDTSGALHGYKIARPGFSSIPDADDDLVRTMYREYGAATGMPRDADVHISLRMTYYYAFNTRRYQHAIDLGTPAAIIETGFLTNSSDRAFLTGQSELAARGITNGILRFLDLELGARQ